MAGKSVLRKMPVHLNLNVRGLLPSATLAVNEQSNRLRARGRTVYKLGLGQSPFPVPTPVVEALQANAFQKDYLPVKGLEELRLVVASYHRRRQQIDAHPENVLIGPGSKELMFLLQLAYYGDLVIPTPTWVSYAPQAHILGRHVRWLNTTSRNGWRLTPDELEAFCRDDPGRPRIVVFNYPSNPTGGSYEPAELKALAKIARRHELILLSDEIYAELHHEGRHVSIARYYPEGTIVSGGLSKWCGAGGWRLGTFTFPPALRWLLDAMANVASETYTSTSAPIQYAAVRAFSGGAEIEAYLEQARVILGALAGYAVRKLRGAGIAVHSPQGAFYLFPDFSAGAERLRGLGVTTSAELCARLLDDTGVATLAGVNFGRPAEELTARIAYVDFDGARAQSAARRRPVGGVLDEAFLEEYCGGVTRALDLMGDWFQGRHPFHAA